ncbi:hypothetical protein F2P81_009364 [Scophthalmus maximus]|uniref:Uncharacterized protein n=1 Tax=Scophthalmus maximus TaxID=52904 RepID=A0A6A4T4C1_SCOMX|nr:hypothetical protein F2P81_009364 [Scophthalmus maximus]
MKLDPLLINVSHLNGRGNGKYSSVYLQCSKWEAGLRSKLGMGLVTSPWPAPLLATPVRARAHPRRREAPDIS